jgi:prevent-host-death family protein
VADVRVPIGQVKRDISDLVNRVAYRGERIVLTSRGKPKAALVSVEDYNRLREAQAGDPIARWQSWLAQADALVADVLARREGEAIPVDDLLSEGRRDLEARGDWVADGH